MTSTPTAGSASPIRRRVVVACAAVALLQAATAAFAGQQVAGDPDASVRLFVDRGLTGIDTARALRVSQQLLGSSGARLAWRDCARDTNCHQPMGGGFHVAVFVRRAPLSPADSGCAVGTRDPQGAGGAVHVDYGCVADAARRLRQMSFGRAHPLVTTVDESDLIGLAIAHEIGHLAGLGHARTGVMRARVDAADILNLRRQSLTFVAREAATLRRAIP